MFAWRRQFLLTLAICILLFIVQNGRSVAVASCSQSGDDHADRDLDYCASQLGDLLEAPPHEDLATAKQSKEVATELIPAETRSSDYDLGKDVEINMIAQLFDNETSPFYLRNRTDSPSQDPTVSGIAVSVSSNGTTQPTSHKTLNDTILHSYNLNPPKNSSVIALFIFGDSTADAGNNAKLFGSLANAKHKPYGLDFDTHLPTGRFSNGRLSADYLGLPILGRNQRPRWFVYCTTPLMEHLCVAADALRLPLIRPYLELVNVYDFVHGVNFASAGAGIFDLSGYDLGARITFAQQVHNFLDVVGKLKSTIGLNSTSHLVSHSLFYISIGSNDFLHNYLLNYTAAEIDHNRTVQPIEIYSGLLVSELSRQIQTLHLAGGRKFAVMGVGPLGCTPHYLYEWDSKDGSCILPVNNLVQKFNGDLKQEILRLNTVLPDVRLVFGNVFDILFRIALNPDSYGFMTGNTACCGVQKFGGAMPCALVSEACADPEDFLWWDEYHPTDKANLYISARIWGGVAEDCFPANVSHLAELPLNTS